MGGQQDALERKVPVWSLWPRHQPGGAEQVIGQEVTEFQCRALAVQDLEERWVGIIIGSEWTKGRIWGTPLAFSSSCRRNRLLGVRGPQRWQHWVFPVGRTDLD